MNVLTRFSWWSMGKTQIGVDVPRTLSEVPFFQEAVIQSTLTRILYIW